MALPFGLAPLAYLKGDTGDKGNTGDTGTFASATATTVAADAPAQAIMSGPQTARTVEFRIPRGLPGVNAVNNDTATAVLIRATDTAVYQALHEGYVTAVVSGDDVTLYQNGIAL